MIKINGRTPEEIKKALGLCPHLGCKSFAECAYEDEVGCSDNLMMDALALIERLESERDAALAKVPKWISVNDRLPEEGDPVLVYVNGAVAVSEVYCRAMIRNTPMWAYTGLGSEPQFWMPLPAPPEGVE